VTGMYPSHHGLVDNHFFDPSFQEKYGMSNKKQVMDHRWYGGYPLWVLAEQQKMLSASFYWVGTEAPIQGIQPTYYFNYNEKIPISRRIQTVVDWLQLPAEQRPHFISFYFPEVDHAGHSYGPESVKTGESVRFVDSVICQLTEAVNKTGLEVNYLFVSDHGMARVDTTRYVYIPAVDTSRAVLVWGGELAQVYVKSPSDIPALYQELAGVAKDYRVILKKDMPARLHYGAKDDVYNRIGDILLIPLKGFTFIARGRKPKAGAHGYDPFLVPEMQSVFFAWGPAFKKGKRISAIKNVDVFPVVASILGLEYQHKIDGNKKLMRKILIR
ncbi:MAG: alkaline phosphatase family protein, partial [Flavisolibacter sp.]